MSRADLIDACLLDLRRHEGLRLKPYRDTVGVLTIGYGRNLDANGIRYAEAELMLQNDVEEVLEAVSKALPWFGSLDEDRQAILVNMAFNLGLAGLLGFNNTLAEIEAGRYDEAAARMLESKWATQVGNRAKELATRMRGFT